MDPVEFRRKRVERWAETMDLVERAERTRVRGLDKPELDRLVLGYRRLTADLALAQRELPASEVTLQLNQLVARAHAIVYRRPSMRGAEVREFLLDEVPSTFRRRWGYCVVATLLFFVPALLAYGVGRVDPSIATSYVPEQMITAAEGGGLHTDEILSVMPSSVLSSAIATNNIGVVFMAFAAGVLFGVGSVYILLFNGLMIGIVVAFYANYELTRGLMAFLLHLRERPEACVVNISSINAHLPFPKAGPYNLAKYAVAGLSETLFQELRGTRVRVTVVHPGGVKTRIARSSRGAEAQAVEVFERVAMTTPERAAEIIVRGIERKRFRVYVGPDAVVMQLLKRLFPNASVRLTGWVLDRAEAR